MRSRRATSSSGRASSSRWRCSSSSSRARTWSTSSAGRPTAWRGISRSDCQPTACSTISTTAGELAHYARAAFDINFDFGGTLGFQEIEGIHNRGDFDLSQHQQFSGKKLEYFDQQANKRYLPYVIETSVGADRTTLAALVNGYREEAVAGEDEGRVVLGLHPALAPIKAGGLPAHEEGRSAGDGDEAGR